MNIEQFIEKHQKVPVEEYPNHVLKEIPNPIVSCRVSTYQHASFIKQCLDGILMQQTDFPFEIVIGEDESSDGTREICIEYAQKHPDIIRLFLHKRENNIHIDGKPTPKFQGTYTIFHCRGKYQAMCEGDDYWTDPLKLQKQVDFLEANESYSGVASKSEMYYMESGERQVKESHNKKTITIKDLQKNLYFQTATLMFRREIKRHVEYFPILSGDKYLFLLIASYGDIHMLQEVTSVYRKHPGGVSHFVTSSQILTDISIADKIKKHSKEFLPNEYKIHILEKVFLASSVIYFSDLIKTTKIYFRITLFNKMEHSRFWYFKHFHRLLQKGIKKIKFKRIAS